jgi:hypothetical protein
MRLTPTTRLIALAVLLLVATGVVWWGVGFHLGSALLDRAFAWRASFGYGPLGLIRLFALAIVVVVTLATAASVPAQFRWLTLVALALGAVLLYGDRSRGDVVAVVLLVFGTAAMSESSGGQHHVGAFAIAVVIAFAALADVALGTPQKIIAVLVRAAFFYAPLLLAPPYLERYALKRVAR